MLKGKPLYKKCRDFIESVDVNDEVGDDGEITVAESKEQVQKGFELATALLVDVAESLHKIATKIG